MNAQTRIHHLAGMGQVIERLLKHQLRGVLTFEIYLVHIPTEQLSECLTRGNLKENVIR